MYIYAGQFSRISDAGIRVNTDTKTVQFIYAGKWENITISAASAVPYDDTITGIGASNVQTAIAALAGRTYSLIVLNAATKTITFGDQVACLQDATITLPAVDAAHVNSTVKINAVGTTDAITITPATGQTVDGEASGAISAANKYVVLLAQSTGENTYGWVTLEKN